METLTILEWVSIDTANNNMILLFHSFDFKLAFLKSHT